MVRHIVLWRLKQPDETDFARIRAALERQAHLIPGLLRVEVGRAFNDGRRAVVDPLIAEHWSLTTTYQILTSMRAAKK